LTTYLTFTCSENDESNLEKTPSNRLIFKNIFFGGDGMFFYAQQCPAQGCQMVIFPNQKALFGYVLEGLGAETVWYILCPFGIFFNHLVCFMAIWYSLSSYGKFIPVLVCCNKKNPATLAGPRKKRCEKAFRISRAKKQCKVARLDGSRISRRISKER
jgi:hypothetical protein